MAIDTRDKRASCLGLDGAYRCVLPNPDVGAEDSGDRLQMAYCYRGIAIAALTAGPYYAAAGQIFTPGASAGELFTPGASAGEVFVPGASAGEVN